MGFWLSFSMSGGTVPEAWRAVAGAVAEATTPIRVIGDSLLRMPVATGMLMVVGRVFREPGREGIITCGEQDSTGVLVWARGWLAWMRRFRYSDAVGTGMGLVMRAGSASAGQGSGRNPNRWCGAPHRVPSPMRRCARLLLTWFRCRRRRGSPGRVAYGRGPG